MPWWSVLGSIVATETSTATFLSVPGLAFAAKGDLKFLQLAMGYIVGRVVVTFVLLPQYFRGELFTAYEVLDQRFGERAKKSASLLFVVARNLGDGLRLFLTAIVLEKVAGIDLSVCIVLIGIATVVYNPGLPEEWGGWFTSLDVEYLDETGAWRSVENLAISPALDFDNSQWLKGSWIDHALTFEPVETTAIRIIGDAGGIEQDERNGGERRFYTAISELTVYTD